MDSTKLKGHGEGSPEGLSRASEKTAEQSSALPEPSVEAVAPKERAITTSHSSVTSDSLRYGVGVRAGPSGGAIGDRGASFILLDDSVYISPGHGLRRNGSQAVPDLPPAGTDLTLDASIFGGRNFDEQIIFLNGPDLLETSVEQESSSPPVHRPAAQPRPTRRQMGKVARAVQLHDAEDDLDDPLALPLRPIVRDPADAALVAEDNVVVMYADQHETVRLNCEVDADITTSVWLKDGQIVHAMDKKSRTADIRFVRESFGGLTIRNVMLEDDGVWQCEAENARGFFFNGRPIKLIVLDPPKEPYLLIDSRRLDAGNMFIPVKENSELTLACVTEGGNPKPMITWEVLLSPGIDRHAQKLPNDVLELQEIKKDKDKEPYKINSGAVSEAKLTAVFRVHHNARILCIMEHPTLKVRQNASILLDVQYTPSFAITRTPGFGYPLREGIEVSLKCDVDSNPPSTPLWQKDDGDTPVPQIGDGFLNFSSIRREHSGWYKCTSRHLNFQYSSIGYYLSVRYEPVDVTSEPVEQDLSLSPSSSSASASSSSSSSSTSSLATNGAGSFKNSAPFGSFPAGSPLGSSSFKPGGQMEVELGGSVTLQCPQGSLGCWSHLDSATVRLKGPGGSGGYGQTGQVSLKDVVYQDAGTYKCVGQSPTNRKKLDVPQTVKGRRAVDAVNAPLEIALLDLPTILEDSPT
uniref:Ig-like domain-containing protein n=1 Tax=Anopheles atroparvus TaxID=41427 RepID=A0A182ISF1_ANOAO